jgi:hypothetical protein
MKSGFFFKLLFLLTIGGFSAWSSTASAGPDWCHGNACDFVQLSVKDECLTATNTSPNKVMTVQWGPYGPFSLRPDQSNTITFSGPMRRHYYCPSLERDIHRTCACTCTSSATAAAMDVCGY